MAGCESRRGDDDTRPQAKLGVIPAKGAPATAEPGPIGRKIAWRGPVLDLAHVIAAARTRNPAVLLNGSRVCPRYARLPGMTVEREALPGCKPPKAAMRRAGEIRFPHKSLKNTPS